MFHETALKNLCEKIIELRSLAKEAKNAGHVVQIKDGTGHIVDTSGKWIVSVATHGTKEC